MNKQIFIMSIFLGILIGFVLFALLATNFFGFYLCYIHFLEKNDISLNEKCWSELHEAVRPSTPKSYPILYLLDNEYWIAFTDGTHKKLDIKYDPSNESSAISLTNRMSKLDYSVEEMMEKEEKRFLSKQYYAYIIDCNSRFWREDKYKVLLLSVPRMEYYDPNDTDWLLIDGMTVCQDPDCIKFYMDQGAWISNDFMGNIKWKWAE